MGSQQAMGTMKCGKALQVLPGLSQSPEMLVLVGSSSAPSQGCAQQERHSGSSVMSYPVGLELGDL